MDVDQGLLELWIRRCDRQQPLQDHPDPLELTDLGEELHQLLTLCDEVQVIDPNVVVARAHFEQPLPRDEMRRQEAPRVEQAVSSPCGVSDG